MNKFKLIYYTLKSFGIIFILKKIISYKPIVVCYHRISKIKIQEHLSWFKRNYSLMQLNDLLDKSINSKQKNSTKNPEIAITMDDCYENDFTNMIDVTLKEQVHCTYFVPLAYVQENKSFWSLRIISSINNLILPSKLVLNDGETKEINNEFQKHQFIKEFIFELQENNIQTIAIENKISDFLKKNKLVDNSDKIINLNTIKENGKNPLVCFQSHTLTHPKLYLCNEEELKNEFIVSKQALDQFDFGYNQETICYPYGSYKLIGNSYKIAGNPYKYGVTLVPGVINKDTNSLLIPRIGIYENDTIYSIELKFLKAQLLNSLKKFKL